MLASLFERCMKRRGVKEGDPYDWEKTTTSDSQSVGGAAAVAAGGGGGGGGGSVGVGGTAAIPSGNAAVSVGQSMFFVWFLFNHL